VSLLNRRDVVRDLLRKRGDLLVVAGLGSPAYDVAAAGDTALDFPLWGAMGGAAMVSAGTPAMARIAAATQCTNGRVMGKPAPSCGATLRRQNYASTEANMLA